MSKKKKEKKCYCGKILDKNNKKDYCSPFCYQIDSNSYAGDTFEETIKRLKKIKSKIFEKYSYPQF